MKAKILIFIILGIATALSVRFVMLGKKSQLMKVEDSYKDGNLVPCESTSNCFDTAQADSQLKERLSSLTAENLKNIEQHLIGNGYSKITSTENYIHYTFQSSLFGFVDDVEFSVNEKGLQFRSASRVGKSDIGANKKRITKIFKETL